MTVVNPTAQWTEDLVKSKLEKAGLDLNLFGVGKALTTAQIANEMNRGESYLMEDAKVTFAFLSPGAFREPPGQNSLRVGTHPNCSCLSRPRGSREKD